MAAGDAPRTEVGVPVAELPQAEIDSFRQSRTVLRSRISAEFGPA